MKKPRVFVLFCLALVMALGAGCAAAHTQSAASQSNTFAMEAPAAPMPAGEAMAGWGMAMDEAAAPAEEAGVDMAMAERETAVTGGAGGQKIIRNASISLETREFVAHVDHVRKRAEEMGGYVSNSYVSGKEPESYYDSGRYASVTARIPQERLESFLADTRGLATVISESTSGDDITANYRDTESRLEVYRAQRDRVLALLEKAETMEDIITLETELSRLTYEIESLTGSLKQWDDLVDYATVNIDIREIPPSTPVTGQDSMGTRMSDGFRKTMNGMAVFFENLLVFIVAGSPVWIILAIIAVVVVVLVRRSGKKQRARMEAQGGFAPATGGYGGNLPEAKREKKEKKQRKQETTKPSEPGGEG